MAVARQAPADGVAEPCSEDEMAERIRARVWAPNYRRYGKPK
jgi:malate dehydrogenase (oxaloacetate-decarboxylating)